MKILSPPYSLKLKNIIESSVLESRLNFFSKWSYLQRRFDFAQRCENRR